MSRNKSFIYFHTGEVIDKNIGKRPRKVEVANLHIILLFITNCIIVNGNRKIMKDLFLF